MRLCAWCREEIQVVSSGDESWDWCEGCQLVEGETIDFEGPGVDANGSLVK